MKAIETNLLKFMDGTKQFMIPIYQRTYSWTYDQCRKLWNDIEKVAKNEALSGHFIGSVVYIQKGIISMSEPPKLMVIDGQQRLTTVSLLLIALASYIESKGIDCGITKRKIKNLYLINGEEDGEQRYKLMLTRSDKETFIKLLEDKEIGEGSSARIVENYRFFEDCIKKSNLDPYKLYLGIGKLMIVDISLDKDHDNPQLIFESLNSTGLDLSQADLIRNYILMGLDSKDQEDIYNDYWYPMEKSFGHNEYIWQFNRFMRDYLTVKTRQIPNIDQVYESFKALRYAKAEVSIKDLVAEIYRYSKHFVKIMFMQEPDKEINQVLADINSLKVDVAYPFLMEVYDDYSAGRINRDEFLNVLKLVEGYVFRRAICGIPTNSLNKTFANFASEIDKADYLNSVKANFIIKDSYRRFPNDEEFQAEFIIKDIYNLRIRNYILRKLENHDRKEKVDVEGYTIEHIMPQNENLSDEWKQELGANWVEIHSRYLHTIGNLTLTGYNSELSDRPFLQKRDMEGGFSDSPIRLNKSLAKLDHWNEDEIKKRAKVLADLTFSIWKYPSLTQDILEKYRKDKGSSTDRQYTLTEHQYLKGETLNLFELLRKRILNLDSSVREEVKKLYIAYKAASNFVDIEPQKSRIRLTLNLKFSEINDPEGRCRDITTVGSWGNGDVEVGVSSPDDIDYVMKLIQQSFDKQREDGNE